MTPSSSDVERIAAQLRACEVSVDEFVVLLTETGGDMAIVETSRLALQALGVDVVELVAPTPVDQGQVAGLGLAAARLLDNDALMASLLEADFIADCTREGLGPGDDRDSLLESGCRVLSIAAGVPTASVAPFTGDEPAWVDAAVELLEQASVLTLQSSPGSELQVDLGAAVVSGRAGVSQAPGTFDVFPAGHVEIQPAPGSITGAVTLSPGDRLSRIGVVRERIRLVIDSDRVSAISGGVDAETLRLHLGAYDEEDTRVVSRISLGLEPRARPHWSRLDSPPPLLRCAAGTVGVALGATSPAHRPHGVTTDVLMAGSTVVLDGVALVRAGNVTEALSI